MTHHVSFDLEFKKNPYKGKMIVIEGIDGAGKTLQASQVVEKLQAQGIDAILEKEPTDMVIGEFIRKDVLSGKVQISPLALQYLFNADRAMHIEKIEALLKAGKFVIMDRYFWSSVAYAMADMEGVGDFYLTVFSVLSFYNRFYVPDLTIFLEIPLTEAVKRIKKSQKHLEIYDHEHKLKKIKEGYDFLLQKFPSEFTKIDADQAPEKVTEEILKNVLRIM